MVGVKLDGALIASIDEDFVHLQGVTPGVHSVQLELQSNLYARVQSPTVVFHVLEPVGAGPFIFQQNYSVLYSFAADSQLGLLPTPGSVYPRGAQLIYNFSNEYYLTIP